MKRVFIGGTGRSGTTILQHVLSRHEWLYVVPIETKFIVQPDGLYSLFKHLTSDYSITDASIAIGRFKALMHDVITHTGPNPYVDFAGQPYGRLEYVPQDLFPDYWNKLDFFFSQITNRYYEREEILGLSRDLVESMFGEVAVSRQAEGWVEKTPMNIFRIEFLSELYPDSVFINCIRDPRGILDSFMRKEWLGGSLIDGANYLVPYYKYIAEKRRFGQGRKGLYYEIKLESLVFDPVGELAKLLEFLQMAPFPKERNEFLTKVLREGSLLWVEEQGKYCDTWERSFSAEEKQAVTAILADVIEEYGYEP